MIDTNIEKIKLGKQKNRSNKKKKLERYVNN